MIKTKLLGFLLLFGLGLSLAQEYTLTLSGQEVTQTAITVDGQIYVPLEALTQAGITATISGDSLNLSLPGIQTAGGADQRESLEGCMGETFFNGIWRARVLSVEAIAKDGLTPTPGWGITVEMRNGTQMSLMPASTGIAGAGQGVHLVTADEVILPVDPLDVQGLTYANLPQGSGVTHQLKFYYPFGTPQDAVQPPAKLLLEMKPEDIGSSLQAAGLAYSTPNPSLRVHLDCDP